MSTTDALNVLIVEDDPIIAMEISHVLKAKGYRIAGVAHTVAKAIDRLAGRDVDFVVLDIHLGSGQSGIDVAAVIHNKYRIPYIFLTAYSDPHTLAATQEQAPFGYLVKPFQPATLLSTIAVAASNFQRMQRGLDFARLPFKLTKQEQKLCQALLTGKSYQEISEGLFISINTVRYHVKNLYLKFNVNARAELIAKLLDW